MLPSLSHLRIAPDDTFLVHALSKRHTDAPDASKRQKESGQVEQSDSDGSNLLQVLRNSDFQDLTFQAVFDKKQDYAVDLPSDAPLLVERLNAALSNLSLCKSDKAFSNMCQDELFLTLQKAVKHVQEQLSAIRDRAKENDDKKDTSMKALTRDDCHLRKYLDFDGDNKWDVWDLAARRNGVLELKHLRSLVTDDFQVKINANGLKHHIISYKDDVDDLERRMRNKSGKMWWLLRKPKDSVTFIDEQNKKALFYQIEELQRQINAAKVSVQTIVLTNATILRLLPHVWGMETWLERHMIVYPPMKHYIQRSRMHLHGPAETWNVINVTNMMGVFLDDDEFNEPIGAWDVSNVTNMGFMFESAAKFNQPIGAWDVSSVVDMHAMFRNAYRFNQPLGFDDVDGNEIPNGGWDVSEVRLMEMMFKGAQAFNQPLWSWNVSNVENMTAMFKGAAKFNQPLASKDADGVETPNGGWDVSNVLSRQDMFTRASSFNQPLESWGVTM